MNVKTSNSIPIATNRTALRPSSTNSQNRSRCSVVILDMAKLRPWLPISRPATTMAIGADMWRASAKAEPPQTNASDRRIST